MRMAQMSLYHYCRPADVVWLTSHARVGHARLLMASSTPRALFRPFSCDVTSFPCAHQLAVLVYSCNVWKHRASISLKQFYSKFGADGLRSQVSSLLLVTTYYTECFSRDIALIERSLYNAPSLLRSVYTSMAAIYRKVTGIYGKWDYRWRKWNRSVPYDSLRCRIGF